MVVVEEVADIDDDSSARLEQLLRGADSWSVVVAYSQVIDQRRGQGR